VTRARTEGPQEIRLIGEPCVVVLAQADYLRLALPRSRVVEFTPRSI
jgi:hypothetical protein